MTNKSSESTESPTGELVLQGLSVRGFSTNDVGADVNIDNRVVEWAGKDKEFRMYFEFFPTREFEIEGKTFEVGDNPYEKVAIYLYRLNEDDYWYRSSEGHITFTVFDLDCRTLSFSAEFTFRSRTTGEEKKVKSYGKYEGINVHPS